MLTPKQKAYLKGLAQKERSVFQIGKDGLNDNMLDEIMNYIDKHELIKVNILRNSFVDEEELVNALDEYHVEFVEHKGNTLVFYKHSNKVKEPIELPSKNNKKK